MHMQTRQTTVTFARPFRLDGLETEVPAGVYSTDSGNDVVNGMLLPDRLRPSALVHLHSPPDSPGHTRTMTVPWRAREAALPRGRSPATTPAGPRLDVMPPDPTVRPPMRPDGVSEASMHDLVTHLPERKLSHVKSER